MDSKITLLIAVAISVIVTAAVVHSIEYEQQIQVTDTTPIDTVPPDTMPPDTMGAAPLDTMPIDTSTNNTAPPDTVPIDTMDTTPQDDVISKIVESNIPIDTNTNNTAPPDTIDTSANGTEPPDTPEIVYVDRLVSKPFEGTNDIIKISSQKDLIGILEASASFNDRNKNSRLGEELFFSPMSDEVVAMSEQASQPRRSGGSAGSGSGGVTSGSVQLDSTQHAVPFDPTSKSSSAKQSGTDYSTTNVQVKNVDEPDYLKNDEKYVYIVSKNTLTIIDAYPAKTAKLILKIALDVESQYIQNMFLNQDRLVIFYDGETSEEIIAEFDFVPYVSHNPVTHALIIDVSDKKDPKILKDYAISGDFSSARMIGNFVYFVTNSYVDYQHPRLPIILENSVKILEPDAYYFDNAEELSNFHTLTAIDIFGDTINSKTYLMGYTGTFYVSEKNFYVTYLQNTPTAFYELTSKDRFFDVIAPLLPHQIQSQIKNIQGNDALSSSEKWIKISELMQDSYNQMGDDQREKLFDEIKDALDNYDTKSQAKTRKTIIHKIAIDEDEIKYAAKGSVPGRLLNQFSMDENKDRFRVATTTEYYTQFQGTVRANAVYILDEQLDRVGGLDGIAPDESIYSARFLGDRLYLVTFQQIDPFFVIDLSKDTPKILGELKIPGFSNYLHPFDDEHVIGIGRDTKAQNNWVEQLGVKIALFNVADVNNPIVADDVIIGDRTTESDAQYNHKSFFFDKTRGILSIPITGDADKLNGLSSSSSSYDYTRWSGFYVFDLDKSGFDLKGTITHSDDDSGYRGIDSARTFYIDDVLYTASGDYLKMNSFYTLDEINSIKLENTGRFINYLEDDVLR